MSKLTKLEDESLERLKRKSDALLNGGKGDLHIMSEVLGELAGIIIAVVRTGGISPEECDERHQLNLGRADQIQAEHMEAMKELRLERKAAIETAIKATLRPPAWLVLARMAMAVAGSSGTVLGAAYMIWGK